MVDVRDGLAEFIKERDAVLENGTVENLVQLYKKYFPDAGIPNATALEIAFHKCRTAAVDISMQKRLVSDAWLKNRGYESFLD